MAWEFRNETSETASDCRILITHWVGEAYERLQLTDYNKIRYGSFEKTGSLITADGSDYTKVNTEVFINYVVPKPLSVQIFEDATSCPAPEPAPEPEDIIIDDYDQFQDKDVPNDDVCIDNENDREYDHIMVNYKICAPYGNGWHMWHMCSILHVWSLAKFLITFF